MARATGSKRGAASAIGCLALLAALTWCPASARGAVQWEEVEFKDTIELDGESRRCQAGSAEETVELEGPARNVEIVSPESGDRADASNGFKVVISSVGVKAGDDGDIEVVIAAVGSPTDADECDADGSRGWSASVDVEVRYERAVGAPDSPPASPAPQAVLPCGHLPRLARDVHAFFTSCAEALTIAQRYMTARTGGDRAVSPYRCTNRTTRRGLLVICRAGGTRGVAFYPARAPALAGRRCGSYTVTIRGWSGLVRGIHAQRTTCALARAVARRYLETVRTLRRPHRVARFRCTVDRDDGSYEVACVSASGQAVMFRVVPLPRGRL